VVTYASPPVFLKTGKKKGKKMRIAVLHGARDFRIEEKPSRKVEKNQCRIAVKACGVCHSELHQWATKIESLEYPRYIGHEVAGVIEECGSLVSGFRPGDRVAVWTDRAGYAEEVIVTPDRIFPIKDSVPFVEAMAEPLSCTTNGVMKAQIEMGDTVALVGTGFMGLILLQQIRLKGAGKIIAVDVREDMLSLAQNLGADVVLNPQKENIKQHINRITGGKGVDVAFEVGGNQSTLDLTADILRMEGTLVIFGYHPGQRVIHDLGYWNWMAFHIVNAHFRDIHTILRGSDIGIRLLNQQKIDLKPLMTHIYPLDEINTAFEAAYHKPKGFVKAVIHFE
jgi:threonine dehydrogenase-like Zn-dependent dehydrogenase